eukprot:SAG11_NODE_11969_length_728_cov_1.418124_1_plen_30_part_10
MFTKKGKAPWPFTAAVGERVPELRKMPEMA